MKVKIKRLLKKPIVIVGVLAVTAAIVLGCIFLLGKEDDEIIESNTPIHENTNNNGGNTTIIEEETQTSDETEEESSTTRKDAYEVTFYDESGRTTLQKSIVDVGKKASYKGPEPTKAESVSHVYTFIGWDKEITAVKDSDQMYFAKFDATEKTKYNVTFLDDDQKTVLLQTICYEGQMPSYTGKIPEKETESTIYTFAGWNKNFSLLTQDTTYIAKYTATAKKQYSATFYNDSGVVLQLEKKFYQGEKPKYEGATPTKERDQFHTYKFKSWNPEIKGIEADTKYYATYEEIVAEGVRDFIAGTCQTTTWTSNNTKLTIPEFFEGADKTCAIDGQKYRVVAIDDYGVATTNNGIQTITLPKSIKSIGAYAFSDLQQLAVIKYAGTKEEWNKIEFCEGWDDSTGNYVVECSNGDVIKKVATYGATFKDGNTIDWEQLQLKKYADLYGYDNTKISDTEIMEGAFDACDSLVSIRIPNTVNKIDSNAFSYCFYLKEVSIPASVSHIGTNPFTLCESLEKITIASDNNKYSTYGANVIVNKDTKELITGCYNSSIPSEVETIGDFAFAALELNNSKLTIPEGVKHIDNYAFMGAKITNLVLPQSLEIIGNSAFYMCLDLQKVEMKTGVTSIGEKAFSSFNSDSQDARVVDLFYSGTTSEWNNITKGTDNFGGFIIHCSDLSETSSFIDGEKYTWEQLLDSATGSKYNYSVTNITNSEIKTGAFDGCDKLVALYIPKEITNIQPNVFAGCANLVSITVDKDNTVYRSENNCVIKKDTNEIVFGCEKSVIPTSATSIGDYAFYGRLFSSINIPRNVTKIGDYAFATCINLESMIVPDSVTSIGEYAFAGDAKVVGSTVYGLTNVVLPSSISEIKEGTFKDCTHLKSVTITDSICASGIRKWAFSACIGLTDIIFKGTSAQWDSITKDAEWNLGAYDNPTIHCVDKERKLLPPVQSALFAVKNTVNNFVDSIFGGEEEVETAVTTVVPNVEEEIKNAYEQVIEEENSQQSNKQQSGSSKIEEGGSQNSQALDSGNYSVTSSNRKAIGYTDETTALTIPNEFVGNGKNGTTDGEVYTVSEIDASAFADCTNLENVSLNEGISRIKHDAFRGCTGLTSVDIPKTITSMGNDIFAGCTSLTSINYAGSVSDWNAINKWAQWDSATPQYVIHCTDGNITK